MSKATQLAHGFGGPYLRPAVAIVGTSYSFGTDDCENYLQFTNGSGVTATVPAYGPSTPFELGASIVFEQSGAGAVTIAPGVGVTIHAPGGSLATTAQYQRGELIQTAKNVWTLALAGGGGSSSLPMVTANIASADILTSFSSPVEVLAAPGANKIYVCFASSIKLGGTVDYTISSGAVGLWYGVPGSNLAFDAVTAVSAFPTSGKIMWAGYGNSETASGDPANYVNQAIVFAADSANPTDGNGDLVIGFAYATLNTG